MKAIRINEIAAAATAPKKERRESLNVWQETCRKEQKAIVMENDTEAARVNQQLSRTWKLSMKYARESRAKRNHAT